MRGHRNAGATASIALSLLLPACVGVWQDGNAEPGRPELGTDRVIDLPAAPVRPPAGGALVIWGRGGLTPELTAAIGDLGYVAAAAHVRSDTLGLTGARAADGAVVTALADGYRVPVDVAAIDPTTYLTTLALEDRGANAGTFTTLVPGTAMLSATSARLRGVGVGGVVDLVGLPDLRVVAVVADGTVGRAEIIVHIDDAEALGLEATDGSIYVRHSAATRASKDGLLAEVAALLPAEEHTRVVEVGAGAERRRAGLILSMAEVKDRFGEFAYRPHAGDRAVDLTPSFVDAHITTASVPLLGNVTCNVAIVDDLRAALDEIVASGLGDLIDPNRYAGCFTPRRISTATDLLSRHAWGIALDINVDLDAPGGGVAPHPDVIGAFERAGFRWGGEFLVPDNHHFEWIGRAP